MLTLSVVMATFEGSRFLREQLRSLADQTELPDEVIISDDGSTDYTLLIAQEFAISAPFPVRIQRNESRKGYRRNFMEAAELCTSELIAFCDQDDVWNKNKLSMVKECFHDRSVLLVHHNAHLTDQSGQVLGTLRPLDLPQSTITQLDSGPWKFSLGFTQVFRRSLLAFSSLRESSVDFYFPEHHLAHDQWIFFLASVLGKISYINRCLVDYRQHATNSFGDAAAKQRSFVSRLSKFLKDLFGVAGHCRHLASNALTRAAVAEQIAQDLRNSSSVRDCANVAAKKYLALSSMLELRVRIYDQPSLSARLRCWLQLLLTKSYGKCAWGFSTKGGLTDLLIGVILGPKKQTLLPQRSDTKPKSKRIADLNKEADEHDHVERTTI